MARWISQTATVGVAALILVGLSGCGSDVRNDPWLNAELKTIKEQQRTLSEIPSQVTELIKDFQGLQDEFMRLKSQAGGGTPQAVTNQLKQFEARLTTVQKQIESLQGEVKGLKNQVAAVRKAPTSPRTTPPATKPAAGGATTEAAKPPPSKPPEPPEPKGKYYEAKSGDTVKSVAAQFNISPATFIKANNPFLKPDSELVPTQRYWIPGK
jgi:LysM repeat protein